MNSVMVRVLYGNVVTERKYDVNYRILLVIFMRFFLTLDWFLDTFMSHHILFCRGTSLTFGNCMQWKESKNDDKYLLEKVCSERKEKIIIDMNIYTYLFCTQLKTNYLAWCISYLNIECLVYEHLTFNDSNRI